MIGRYPALSLKVARKRAKAAQVGLQKEPPVDRATGTRERRTAKTFGDVRDDYIAQISGPAWVNGQRTLGRTSWKETKRILESWFCEMEAPAHRGDFARRRARGHPPDRAGDASCGESRAGGGVRSVLVRAGQRSDRRVADACARTADAEDAGDGTEAEADGR